MDSDKKRPEIRSEPSDRGVRSLSLPLERIEKESAGLYIPIG
jgi:hypothetical protein